MVVLPVYAITRTGKLAMTQRRHNTGKAINQAKAKASQSKHCDCYMVPENRRPLAMTCIVALAFVNEPAHLQLVHEVAWKVRKHAYLYAENGAPLWGRQQSGVGSTIGCDREDCEDSRKAETLCRNSGRKMRERKKQGGAGGREVGC